MSEPISPTGFNAPDPAHLADLFPGFQIIRLIACGGMGAVYEAVQNSLDRPVAIKILPREFTHDESFRNAFETEAKTMARLNHPNLIGVYEFGEIEGMLYITMEYVPGLSLFQAANGKPILPGEVVPLISAIARGLAHAHENGIIHRDIKPANILLNHNNEPKIGDFGLARPRERQILEGETIFGTPGYTAPEVIHNPQSIDHRADIFSLGVLLHELLTGTLPDADPRPASAICRCDFRFDKIIRKATHPDPDQRYNSAADIAAELAKIKIASAPRNLRTSAPSARQAAAAAKRYQPRHTPTQSGSNTTLIVTLGVFIVIVILILIFKSSRKPSTPTPEVPAVDPVALPESAAPTIPPPSTPSSKPPQETPLLPTIDPEPPAIPSEPDRSQKEWSGASSSWDDQGEIVNFTVRSGRIGGTRDAGVFNHQQWTGDGVFTLHIQTLFGGVTSSTAGLMIREDLDAGARNVFLACNRNGETTLQSRTLRNEETTESNRSSDSLRFLRLRRAGDQFFASASHNGNEWTDLGSIVLEDLSPDIHIGFAAASDTANADPMFAGSYDSFERLDSETSIPQDDVPDLPTEAEDE